MNELLQIKSEKLIMRDNKNSPFNKEKARKLILNNADLKTEHIFDKLNYFGLPEETNDKTNHIMVNDSNSILNNNLKFKNNCEEENNKLNVFDKSPKDNILKINIIDKNNTNINNDSSNIELNEIERNKKPFNKNISTQINNFKMNRVNNSCNFENFNNRIINNTNLLNTKNNININSNSNIYIRNNNMNINSFGDNRFSKIYKEDSFDSKKTFDMIKQRKSTLRPKSCISDVNISDKYLTSYFDNFRDFFNNEKILEKKLNNLYDEIKKAKILEVIKSKLYVKDKYFKNNIKIVIDNNDEIDKKENKKHLVNFHCEKKENLDKLDNNGNNKSKVNKIEELSKTDNNTDIDTTRSNDNIFKYKNKNYSNKDMKIFNNNSNKSLYLLQKNPIGPLCELNKIYFLCSLKNSKNEIEKISKDLVYWRLILGDGNCFYRSFIFSLLELWILQMNLENIEKFLCDFFYILETEKNNDLIQQKNFNKIDVCGIFYLIIEQLKNNNKESAYEIFLNAYQKYTSFDTGLIIYMRLVLFNYISRYKTYLYNKESQIEIGHLLPNEYIDENDNFLFEEFFRNFLLRINSEAEKIIIYLSPIIFGVNLDIMILEDLASVKKSSYNVNNYQKNLNKNEYDDKNKNLNNSNTNNDEAEIKFIRQYFPCYKINNNVEIKLTKLDHTIENQNSRNKKSLIHEKNFDSINNNYFNTNMLMTIKENDDQIENYLDVKLEENKNNYISEENKLRDWNNDPKINEEYFVKNKSNLSKDSKYQNEFIFKEDTKNLSNFINFNTISLLYRSAHYDKIYTKNFTDNFKDFDIKLLDNKIFLIKEDIFSDRKLDLENKYCERCQIETKFLSFKHLSEFGFFKCKFCLLELIDNIFKERIKEFIENEYNNLECINIIKFFRFL